VKPRKHKPAQGQTIYLWRELGDRFSGERKYRVTAAPVTWYVLNATDNGEQKIITDSYPDLYDGELHVLEELDGLSR
jgi:hypothetical protein